MQMPCRLFTKVRCTIGIERHHGEQATRAVNNDHEEIMKVNCQLTWMLALMLNATGSAAGEPEDPYAWLEDVSGAKPLAWVKEKNAQSTKELTRSADFQALERRSWQSSIPRIGSRSSRSWAATTITSGAMPGTLRGLWRRTTLDEYKKPRPSWETVLDLDLLGKEEKENWVWHGAQALKPDYQRALVSLSRGGADASVVREFDLTEKAFVADGFILPEAKSQVAWRNRDSIFVGTDFGPGSLTDSGYPRVAKEWKRGTPLAEAVVVMEGLPSDMSVSATRDLTPGFERDIVVRRPTFWTSEVFLRRGGKLVKIDKPADAVISLDRQWLLLRLRSDWKVAGKTCTGGALIATDLEQFLAGSREFDVLFEPGERTSLAGVTTTRHFVLVSELDNVRSRVYVLDHRNGKWHREPLPGVPDFGDVSVQAIDPDESDDYFLHLNDFLTPNTLRWDHRLGPGRQAQAASFFLRRLFAHRLAAPRCLERRYDGSLLRGLRKDLSANGKNPTLLYGYGGFEVSMLPTYRAAVGAAWLEKGGVFVLANIRGGGEFGPKWHQSALKANRYRRLRRLHRSRRRPDPAQGDNPTRIWASRAEAMAAS